MSRGAYLSSKRHAGLAPRGLYTKARGRHGEGRNGGRVRWCASARCRVGAFFVCCREDVTFSVVGFELTEAMSDSLLSFDHQGGAETEGTKTVAYLLDAQTINIKVSYPVDFGGDHDV